MPSSANKPKLRKRQRLNKFLTLLCLLGIASIPSMAAALEYRSVASPKAILYNAPSSQAKKLFVVSQGYPVEVIVNLGNWIKVRDHFGTLSWMEAKDLDAKHTLIVTLNGAELHQAPDPGSKVVSKIEQDVMLEMLEPPAPGPSGNSWLKVRHQDGLTGYILASSVWGY